MSKEEKKPVQVDDDEPDDWDKRIFSTGCAGKERDRSYIPTGQHLTETSRATEDERLLLREERLASMQQRGMEAFRECWKRHGNNERTETRDN
ncbi:hypothetical protein MferCBS31731_005272 [Microsporum ferrugineum]